MDFIFSQFLVGMHNWGLSDEEGETESICIKFVKNTPGYFAPYACKIIAKRKFNFRS